MAGWVLAVATVGLVAATMVGTAVIIALPIILVGILVWLLADFFRRSVRPLSSFARGKLARAGAARSHGPQAPRT